MHLTLKPVGSIELEAIEITSSLFAIGRYEPPFSSYERAKVVKLSKRHARIFEQDGQIYVADLGSTNGTLLNGRPVQAEPQIARTGDEVSFGGLTYKVNILGGADETADPGSLRLVLTPERDKDVLESIVVSRFPFLINKYSDAFARYQEVLPEQLTYISRRHAHFFVREGSLYVEDLDSTNGTFVSGEQLDEHARQLADGDTIAFGGDHFVYRVHILAETADDAPPTTESIEAVDGVELADSTIFIDSPTSFVEIYVGARERDIAHEELHAAEEAAAGLKDPKTSERSNVGRSLAFMGELKTALLGDKGISSRSRWTYRTIAAALVAGGAYYYWSSMDLRRLERELDDGAFLEAAMRANSYLAQHPQAEPWRKLATQALLKHVTPEWQTHIEVKSFDEALRLIVQAEDLSQANPDDDKLLAILKWATRVASFLDRRGRGATLNEVLEQGATVRELVSWWDSDARTHARELLRLSGIVSAFAPIRDRLYSDVRQLHALDREQRPVQAFRERLAEAFQNQNIIEIRQAIVDFEELDQRFKQSPGLSEDADRMSKVFQAIRESRGLDAYQALTAGEFQTRPFAEQAEAMIGNGVPDRETVTRYQAVKSAWRDGRTDEAFRGLDQLAAEVWGSEAAVLAKRYGALLDGYEELMAIRGQAGYETQLFEYSGRLDRDADRFLVERIEEDFQASADAALALAGNHVATAAKHWEQYRALGGIRTEQRLENAVSTDFRALAELLGNTHDALHRGQQIYARLEAEPSQRWRTLQTSVANEVSVQRHSLENLRVLDPAVRQAKLALLPE